MARCCTADSDSGAKVDELEGGYGWCVVGGSFIGHLMVLGMQYSFGVTFIALIDFFQASRSEVAWVGGLTIGMQSGMGLFCVGIRGSGSARACRLFRPGGMVGSTPGKGWANCRAGGHAWPDAVAPCRSGFIVVFLLGCVREERSRAHDVRRRVPQLHHSRHGRRVLALGPSSLCAVTMLAISLASLCPGPRSSGLARPSFRCEATADRARAVNIGDRNTPFPRAFG